MPNTNLAPTWALQVNGQAMPDAYRALINSISVDASTDGADELTIEATAYDTVSGEYRLISDTMLAMGNIVVVSMGYADGDFEVLQSFRLIRSKPQYPESGTPRITVRGYSAEHRLVEYRNARKWDRGVTDADIAREIAAAHGLVVTGESVEDTPAAKRARVKEGGVSDLEFLQQLAVANGFGAPFVRYRDGVGDVLHFKAQKVEEIEILVYDPHAAASSSLSSGDLLSFQTELSLSDVPTRIQVTGWDPVAQQPVQVTVQITDAGQSTDVLMGAEVKEIPQAVRNGGALQVVVLEHAPDPSAKDKQEPVVTETIETEADALAYAELWFMARLWAFTVGRGSCLGRPTLWAGSYVEVRGVAPTDQGVYEVTACRHVINGRGYRCDIDLARVLLDAENIEEL